MSEPLNSSIIAPKPPKKLSPYLAISIGIATMILIAVASFFTFKYFGSKQQIAKDQSSSSLPVEITDPTSDWEQYTNTAHHVSFRYPPSWTLSELTDLEDVAQIDSVSIMLSNQEARINIYLNIDGINSTLETHEGEKFILDGNSLYQYHKVNDYNDTKEVGISNSLTTKGDFTINDIIYRIVVTYPLNYSSENESALLSEFDQILSTFKFTN
ncbi:MAG: hypothetical protein ABII80_00945 [bacterium]